MWHIPYIELKSVLTVFIRLEYCWMLEPKRKYAISESIMKTTANTMKK